MTSSRNMQITRTAHDARERLREQVHARVIGVCAVAGVLGSWRFTRLVPLEFFGRLVRFAVYTPVDEDCLFTHTRTVSDYLCTIVAEHLED